MIKKLGTINRTKELRKVISNNAKELRKIKDNCKHEVIVEISYNHLKYGYHCNENCLFCGEKLARYLDYKYIFHFINVEDKYLPVLDKEFELVQQLFIETANSNPDMSLDEICEKINQIIKSKFGENYTMLKL